MNGALDKLENLQHHENEEIYKQVYALIDAYFLDGVRVTLTSLKIPF